MAVLEFVTVPESVAVPESVGKPRHIELKDHSPTHRQLAQLKITLPTGLKEGRGLEYFKNRLTTDRGGGFSII